jgi:hypothetical protein
MCMTLSSSESTMAKSVGMSSCFGRATQTPGQKDLLTAVHGLCVVSAETLGSEFRELDDVVLTRHLHARADHRSQT